MTEYAAGKYRITGPRTFNEGGRCNVHATGDIVVLPEARAADVQGDLYVRREDGTDSGYIVATSLTPLAPDYETPAEAEADTVAVLAVIEALGFLDVDEDTVSKAITLARLIEKGV